MGLIVLLLTLLGFCHQNVCGQNLEFYVSVDGSDSWDGTSETNVDGSDVGPWQTLNHAFEELRTIRPDPPTADSQATIFLLPGTHFLTSTIQSDERDSYLAIRALGGNSIEKCWLGFRLENRIEIPF